jgi:acetyl esterase/lipase
MQKHRSGKNGPLHAAFGLGCVGMSGARQLTLRSAPGCIPPLKSGRAMLLGLFLATFLPAETVTRAISFARVDDTELKLDLYRPEGPPAGVIVWVHGGAWRGGSRESVDVKNLTTFGWAIASVDYRLSTQARFPAQVHDIKAAIRYLRTHATELGLPADRIFIAGSSAGAHLAALVGVSNGHAELEGTVGESLGTSSDVQAIVDLYGASNLTTILQQSTPHGLSVRVPALDLLLGGQPVQMPEVARLASPVFHVDRDDPPLLLLHGDQDPQMPLEQSLELKRAYERFDLPLDFKILTGSAHGGPAFTSDASLHLMDDFLRRHFVRPKPVSF